MCTAVVFASVGTVDAGRDGLACGGGTFGGGGMLGGGMPDACEGGADVKLSACKGGGGGGPI